MADKLSQFKGTILENGYGILSKFAMRDVKLSIGPKALYSYLTTWGNECFPGRDLICHDLNINKKTFTNYLSELKKRGYITVKQVKEEGRFSHNLYTIEHDLEKIMAIHRGLETKEKQEVLPCTRKRNTVKKNAHRVQKNRTPNFGTPKNGAVIIQASNNTNFKNTTNKGNVVALSPSVLKTDGKRELIAGMVELGIQESNACTFISQEGLAAVKQQVENLEKAIREGRKPGKKPVTNPGGWLRIALKEHFADNKYKEISSEQKAKARKASLRLEEEMQARLAAETEDIEINPQSPFAQIVKRMGISLQS